VRGLRASALAAAAILAACGRTPADEQVLIRFFEQSRVYDRTMLSTVAAVAFNPRTDGVVRQFTIVERRPDRRLEGDAVARDLTLRAQVQGPDGRTGPRMLAVTLERRDGRWMVTGVR
jgi:hypothetical protein